MDAKPRTVQGKEECTGFIAFRVADGRLDDVDLSGVDFALYNYFPSNLTAGNWKVGLVVDSAATDQQASAMERILSGQEGGPFAALAQFFGEYLGMKRASVSITDTDKPTATIEGMSSTTFETLQGPDGRPTTVKNAMFGFAPEFAVGRGPGHSDAFGLKFEGSYGERANYAFSSEAPETAPHGRA
jgi:hypothetical protein